jgi:ribosomal protein S12 methylthiotransferase accessory factor
LIPSAPVVNAGAALVRCGSSLRERSLADTWARARRLAPRLGISRVTLSTPLDRLGLPVANSVRPRGRTLCVHAGKGLTPLAARVGAAMEAIEHALADPLAGRPYLARQLRVSDWLRHIGGAGELVGWSPGWQAEVPLSQTLTLVDMECLPGPERAWAPAALVFAPWDADAGTTLFGWSSNGLASGNSVVEATLHGLFEVLERDALALNAAHDRSAWIDPETLPAPLKRKVRAWVSAGLVFGLRQLPSDFGLACYEAIVHDPNGLRTEVAHGSGAHVSHAIAITRAVCEAAQSRLSHIHGARDDIEASFAKTSAAEKRRRDGIKSALLARFANRARVAHWPSLPVLRAEDTPLQELLDAVLDSLRAGGLPQVLRHVFAGDNDTGHEGLCVVRIVVPGAESLENHHRRLGRRLYAVLSGQG